MNTTHVQMLLAEDSASDADLILASLAKVSLAEATRVVHDGVETLDFVFCRGDYVDRQNEPPLRVIVLDVKLPNLDGFEVLREIKAHSRTRLIPIVLLTSSNIDADIARGYLLGANSYVQKPVDFEEFRETIRRLGLYWMTINEPPPPKQLSERTRS
ncbi:MAG TPA: response regulator [Gemmatimonadaceae bacterium]|nr:response regulator [Gemmatimonadaceae bacterium]